MIVWPYVLCGGHSRDPASGTCAMAAVSWLVHGEQNDWPICACPVITAFVIEGNDSMPHDTRQRLLGYLHRIAGSRSRSHEADRAKILALAAIRVFAPMALDVSENSLEAAMLRALPVDASFSQADMAARVAVQAAMGVGLWSLVGARLALAGVMENAFYLQTVGYDVGVSAQYAAKALEATPAFLAGQHSGAAAALAVTAKQSETAVWDAYFVVLDEVLNAGPQGEPWSADSLSLADAKYRAAGGLVAELTAL